MLEKGDEAALAEPDPLGCEHTDVDNACSSAVSIPLDMARIGQMLLQKGAYGNKRFFSEATFKQMLPETLTKVLGPDTTTEYGCSAQTSQQMSQMQISTKTVNLSDNSHIQSFST